MVKEVPLEHLLFSQRRQLFEVGWKGDRRHELQSTPSLASPGSTVEGRSSGVTTSTR
jgi:hypothetical protein